MNTNTVTKMDTPTSSAQPVTLEVIAEETSTTDGATGANFLGERTIKSYIEKQLAIVQDSDTDTFLSNARRLENLGFKSCANLKYANFLAAFRSSPRHTRLYLEEYPNCVFLPWAALHVIVQALDLWVDLPENYLGAVPDNQLMMLEMFEMSSEHAPKGEDFLHMIKRGPKYINKAIRDPREESTERTNHRRWASAAATVMYDRDMQQRMQVDNSHEAFHFSQKLEDAAGQFARNMFVVAPPEAFATTEDWPERVRQLKIEPQIVEKEFPDDPLVIKPVENGVLIVAAWGDEGAIINQAVRDMKL